MTDLRRIDPQKIFTSWWGDYKAQKEIIGYELVKLNACLLVLEKVGAFPFHIFAPSRQKAHIWELISICFFDSAVMAIWKIGIDAQPEGLTLRQFKNGIICNLPDDSVRSELIAALRETDFEEKLSRLEGKVRELRHNIVAHWSRKWLNADSEFRHMHAVGLSHLKDTAKVLDDLYHLLCFGSDFATLPIDYFLEKHSPGRGTDIDELLDNIVRKSRALRRPEKSPEAWRTQRATMSNHDVEKFNLYRKKFGLEPV